MRWPVSEDADVGVVGEDQDPVAGVASAEADVVEAGGVLTRNSSLGGLSWYVYGDDGNMFFGTHLSGYENTGLGHVERGTVIGYVGNSGNARGTSHHLHFGSTPAAAAPSSPGSPRSAD
jgi:hypothetical protein